MKLKMQEKSEHTIQKEIVSYLRSKGYYTIGTDVMSGLGFLGNNQGKRIAFINHHKGIGYTKGQPDFVAIKGSDIYFIECKDHKGTRTKEQKEIAEILQKQGLNYILARGIEDVCNI